MVGQDVASKMTYYLVAAGVSELHSIAVALATHTSSCHDAVTSRAQPTGTSPTTWTFCAGRRSFCDAERRSETLRLTGAQVVADFDSRCAGGMHINLLVA